MRRDSPGQESDKLLRILRGAYLEREKAETGDRWQAGVMRRIREMGTIERAPGLWGGFTQFTWRLAPATVLLVLASIAFLVGSGLTPGYEAFDSILSELTLMHLFAG